ncbi:class I SAM-dependent methyltransferase [Bacillus sp. Marseille-P3661]|uniref:class I SAM-dependent methyltransferase n=1 Tax=Bacillus sp. Marseille-P3661 TaxID=1936234 RepID=UPI001CA55E5B|nr:class I SAM-dependent methyltransferase [Bacillus sp. Marseille-P3661]
MVYLIMQTILLLLFIISIGAIVFSTIMNGISPMPTSRKATTKITSLVKDYVNQHQSPTIYDLGSGWGTLLYSLAKRYPHATIIGIENSLIPFYISKLFVLFGISKSNIKLIFKNFNHVNLQSADIILCYLFPLAMEKLKHKFLMELNPGTIIISHTFEIRGWTPVKIIEINDFYKSNIYVYQLK